MKKLLFFATALLVLASCSNKDNALNNAPEGAPFRKGQQVTLNIGTGSNAHQAAPRKVAGTDNTTDGQIDFTWEENDKILVKVGGESAVFTLSSTPGSAYGEFTGTMPASGSTFDIQYPIEAPNLSAQVYTAEKTIPADMMLFKATNCTLGNTATLYAQNAMVQLNLYGTDKTVGKIVFTNKTASPAVSYTLTCTGGKTIGTASASATPFYMVVPAGSYQFEVEVWDNATTPAKICSFATSEIKTFTAGECLNMPAKEVAEQVAEPFVSTFVPTAVDLGLRSGIKWANVNVGATKPEEYGAYFAWGETYTKTLYTWQTYFDCMPGSDGEEFIEYWEGGSQTLGPGDDAASLIWDHLGFGQTWRTPTKEEQDELRNNCTWTWTALNGVNGYEVKGSNGNTIFLPAAGRFYPSSLIEDGSIGRYWSSSLYVNEKCDRAYFLEFNSGEVKCDHNGRLWGLSVRPVCQ